MKATIWIAGGGTAGATYVLDVEPLPMRDVEPSSVSFPAPKAPVKAESVIVDNLGVPPAGDDHNDRPPFWGRR